MTVFRRSSDGCVQRASDSGEGTHVSPSLLAFLPNGVDRQQIKQYKATNGESATNKANRQDAVLAQDPRSGCVAREDPWGEMCQGLQEREQAQRTQAPLGAQQACG